MVCLVFLSETVLLWVLQSAVWSHLLALFAILAVSVSITLPISSHSTFC